jgi:uncharacterized RDD family membrane protein YckC
MFLLLFGLFFLVLYLSKKGLGDVARSVLIALSAIAAFLITWGYYFFFEAFKDGQTPGKRTEGLRVVRDGGLPVDVSAAALRNLVRYVDFLPFTYIIGMWTIFASSQCKRLGDYAAGTIVVKERVGEAPKVENLPTESSSPEGQLIKNADWITPDEYQMIKRFVERRDELNPEVREQIAKRLADPLIGKLEIDVSTLPKVRYSIFLVELQRKASEERGYL